MKTLASKLRTYNKLMSEKESNMEEKVDSEETMDEEKPVTAVTIGKTD